MRKTKINETYWILMASGNGPTEWHLREVVFKRKGKKCIQANICIFSKNNETLLYLHTHWMYIYTRPMILPFYQDLKTFNSVKSYFPGIFEQGGQLHNPNCSTFPIGGRKRCKRKRSKYWTGIAVHFQVAAESKKKKQNCRQLWLSYL